MSISKILSARVAAMTCACAVSAVTAVTASAQTGSQAPAASASASGESTSLKEVIVTAQRRAQDLQKVPIAVTNFTSNQLAAQQIVSTQDLERYVPNMFASSNVGQGSANVYYLRGLGQTQSFPTFEPQVGPTSTTSISPGRMRTILRCSACSPYRC